MFKRGRKFCNTSTHEEVMFKCLQCGQDKLKGKRDKATGELFPSGLQKHISQKLTKGDRVCQSFYYNELQNDFTTSLMADYHVRQPIPPPAASVRLEEEEPEDHADHHMDGLSSSCSSSSSEDYDDNLGKFKDIILPLSNSLGGNACFVTNRENAFDSFTAAPLPTITQMDTYTFPSKKLFPHIELATILKYAQNSKAMLVAKVEAAAAKLEAIMPTGAMVEEQDDDLGFIIDEDYSIAGSSAEDDDLEVPNDTDEEGSEGSEDDVQVVAVLPQAPPLAPGNFPGATYLLDRDACQGDQKDRSFGRNVLSSAASRCPSETLSTAVIMVSCKMDRQPGWQQEYRLG